MIFFFLPLLFLVPLPSVTLGMTSNLHCSECFFIKFVSGLISRGMNTDVRMPSNPIAGPLMR